MGLYWLIILALLSSCASGIPGPQLTPSKSEASQKGPNENPNDRKSNNYAFTSPVIILNNPNTDAEKAKTANQLEQGWDWKGVSALLISGAALIVSALAWRVNVNRNKLERPWFIARPKEETKPEDVIRRIVTAGELKVDFFVKNIGPRPGFMVEQFVRLKDFPYPLPDGLQPDYSNAKPCPEMVFAPNENHGQKSESLIVEDTDVRTAIADGRRCIALWGRVGYYDTQIKRELHHTHFFCCWCVIKNSAGQITGYAYIPNGHANFIKYT